MVVACSSNPENDSSQQTLMKKMKPIKTVKAGEQRVDDRGSFIAIVPGSEKYKPPEKLLTVIESELFSIPELKFVERTGIRKILAEQKLNLSGVVQPEKIIQAGKLVQANMFIFIEAFTVNKSKMVSMTFTETRTGIQLANIIVPEKDIFSGETDLPIISARALNKLNTPDEERLYISMLSLRNEEPGHYLDKVLGGLNVMIAHDLSKIEKIVLLDRTHIDRLRTERELSDAELAMKSACLFLEGAARRSEDGKNLVLDYRVYSIDHEIKDQFEVISEINKFSMTREKFYKQINEKLVGGSLGGDIEIATEQPRKEARLFANTAKYYLIHELKEKACQAAEAAFCLYPCKGYNLLVVKAWMLQSEFYKDAKLYRFEPDYISNFKYTNKNLPSNFREIVLKRSIRAALAVNSYIREGYSFRMQYWPEYAAVVQNGFIFGSNALKVPIEKGETGLIDLRNEIRDIQVENFKISLGEIKKKSHPVFYAKATKLGLIMAPYWYPSVEQYIGFVSTTAPNALETIDAFSGVSNADRNHSIFILSENVARSIANMKKRMPDSTEQAKLIELEKTLATHNEPIFRFAGLTSLDGQPAIKDFLGIIKKYKFHREPKNDWELARMLMDFDYDQLDKTQTDQLCQTVMDYFLEPENHKRIPIWVRIFKKWMRHYEKLYAEEDEEQASQEIKNKLFTYAEKMLSCIEKGTSGSTGGRIDVNHIQFYQKLQETYSEQKDQSTSIWDNFIIEELNINKNGSLKSLFYRNKRLYLVYKMNSAPFEFAISSFPIEDGAEIENGSIVTLPQKYDYYHLWAFDAYENKVAFSNLKSGIVYCEGNKCNIINDEKGLPSNCVNSLAFADNQIYLGFGECPFDRSTQGGGLVVYDPDSQKLTTLYSGRSTKNGSLLSSGKPYSIKAMLPDSKRGSIFMGINFDGEDYKEKLTGLWRYDVFEKKITRLAMPLHPHYKTNYFRFRRLFWHKGDIMASDVWDIVSINPDTGTDNWLVGSHSPYKIPTAYLAGEHVFVGDYLISTQGGQDVLQVYSKNSTIPSFIKKTLKGKDIHNVKSLEVVDDKTALVIINEEEVWKLSLKER